MKKLAFLLLLSPFTAFAQKGDVFPIDSLPLVLIADDNADVRAYY